MRIRRLDSFATHLARGDAFYQPTAQLYWPFSAASYPAKSMPDKYDPYREALIMETETVWPAEYADLPPADRQRIALALHENPAEAANLEYVRVHTGFARRITVTPEDVARVS